MCVCVWGGVSRYLKKRTQQGNDETSFREAKEEIESVFARIGEVQQVSLGDRKKCWSSKCTVNDIFIYKLKTPLLIWQRMISMDYWN